MVDVLLSGAIEVAKCLFAPCLDPVGRRCGYVTSYDDYVGQLEHQAKKLDNERQTKQGLITEAKKYGKKIHDNVEKWMKEAENDSQEARRVLDDNETAIKTCFYGWLPNPKARYRLGRDARTIAERIQKLLDRIPSGKVCDDNAAPGRVDGAPDGNSSDSDGSDTITDSRPSLFQGIMKALDDEKLKVIGVYGPGGVGKTTLLEEVGKKLRKEGRPFKMIAKSTVSQNPDVKKIQDDIAYAFRLNLKDEPSEVGRRDLLSKILKDDPREKEKEEVPKEKKGEEVPKEKEKFLIILEDLWDTLDLKKVGIPLGEESNKCQLLLASRDRSVLEQKMGAHPTFHLEGLSKEEAFRLFEETYGPDKLKADEGLKAKADQVVAKLAGVPLFTKSVARTLKCGDESTWDTALIKIEDPKVNDIVEWSYGRLKSSETESLFLLCGFVGGSIPVELLLGLGMGLGLFEGFDMTIRSSRNKLNEMLRRLRSICLLLDGSGDEEKVTIHDLYSEEVISTPLTGQNTLMTHRNAGSWPKKKLEKCWVCLVNVGSHRLAELRLYRFPDSKIFMLSEQRDERDCHGLDFASMKELRVLYLRSINFTSFCSSIEILENLQSLYLDRCDVEDVAILGELKSLQILSFAWSSISSLPKEIGKLTKLKSLNLSHCWKLGKIEPGVLKGLINLEELYMRGSFDQWMGEDEISSELCNAKLAELKSLRKLSTLEISIPNPTVLLEDGDLPLGNLNRFWINIGNANKGKFEGLTAMMLDWKECNKGKFEGLTAMMLDLEGCDSILSKEWVQKTLQKTQYLRLEGLTDSKKSAHELCSRGFPKLKYLVILNCSSIEDIVGSSTGAFPLLESLSLENLGNLEKICDGPECFSKLKAMRVTKCDRLEYIWCLSQMHELSQLEEIKVRRCDSMRAIAIHDARKDIVVVHNRVELPNLRDLQLTELPKMTSFCIEAGITSDGAPIQVWFPRLESVEMVGLLDLEEILYGQPPSGYINLKSIEIRKSKSTSSSILKSDWILKLPNLEFLMIENSPLAEVVFDLEELKGTGHVEILSRLTKLCLSRLPNLQRMFKENAQLKGISVFRKLQELRVYKIGLAFLFPVYVAKCLREIRSIRVFYCEKMEVLVVDEDGRDEGTNDFIEFPLLKELYTNDCPMKSFSNFCRKKESVPITSDSQDAYSDSFFDPKVSLPSLERLGLSSLGSFKSIWPRELSQSSFDNLAELHVSKCSDLPNVFPLSIMGRLHNLTTVVIIECPSLETVFECGPLESNTTEQTGVVPVRLDSQTVSALPNLERVWVKECSKLRYLFPYDVATTLEKLKSLEIEDCEQMKEVVTKEGGGQSKADMLIFPNLMSLAISQCPNFRAFIPNPTSVERPSGETAKENGESQQPLFSEMVTFPSLNNVYITGVRVKELWSNQTRDEFFRDMRSLQLMECENLQRIAPSHVWKRLRHSLKMLKVTSCRLIEIIDDDDAAIVETGQLRILVLDDLENLRHIWRYDNLPNINVPFPNLRDIEVRRCPRLTTLFETFTASFIGQIKWLEVESCEDMELIADHGECEGATCTTITFSELDALKLKEMPKFRGYLPEKYHVEFPSHMRAFIRVGCGQLPDQYYGSDLRGWEEDRYRQRHPGYTG